MQAQGWPFKAREVVSQFSSYLKVFAPGSRKAKYGLKEENQGSTLIRFTRL